MGAKPHPMRSCLHCSGWILPYLLIMLGAGIIVLGIFSGRILDEIINERVNRKVDLRSPESFAYKVWENQTFDAPDPYVQRSFQAFIFEVANPTQVLNNAAKPQLVEYGPYFFKYNVIQRNVSFYYDPVTDREHISFKTQEWFEFDPTRSTCRGGKKCTNSSADEDVFTTINLPVLTVLVKIKSLLSVTPSIEAVATAILDAALGQNQTDLLFTSNSVRDLTFGYQNSFLSELCKLDPEGILGITDMVPGLGGHNNEPQYAGSISERGGFNKMNTKGDKVGWLSQFSGSSIAQCCSDPPCPPNDEIDVWGNVEASTVEGTDATMFGKRVRETDVLTVWTTETNRTTKLAKPYLPNDRHKVKYHGVQLFRFRVKESEIENATVNHDNAAYFMFGASGLINITRCAQNAPIFLSKPHFLDVQGFMPGNPKEVTSMVDGLKPSRDLHDTFLDVEPLTGSTFRGEQRLQAAVYVTPYRMGELKFLSVDYNVTLFEDIQPALVPVAWFSKGGMVTKRITDEYHATVDKAMTFKGVFPPCALGFGCALIAVCLLIIALRWRRSYRVDDAYRGYMYARDPEMRQSLLA